MKHIVQFSGGKDSTAMLLKMLEKRMPVDDIIFCDTGMEFPDMYKHIEKVEKYICRPITRLKAEHNFDYYFSDYEKVKGKNKGSKGYGWPRMWARWCTRIFKQEITKKYLAAVGAADEPKRHVNIPKNTVHPLYDWGITEAEALRYCTAKALIGMVYISVLGA